MATPETMPDDVRARLEELARTQQQAPTQMPEDVARRTGQQLTPSRGFLRTADDLARMAAQGATFGFMDEATSAARAGLGAFRDLLVSPTLTETFEGAPRGYEARYAAAL